VASLSEELDNLRRSICCDCKKKFVLCYAPVPSSSHGPLAVLTEGSGRPTQTASSDLPPVLPTKAAAANTSIPIRSINPQRNQTNSTILAPPEASSSVIPTPPSIRDEIKEPSWNVSHNPQIKAALHIDLVKTLTFTATAIFLKFSPDGKYLALGLGTGSGRTYIYDMEKGLNFWSALCL
jgi:hypothetical protein